MIAMKKKKLEALPPFPLRECGEKPYKMVANLATIEEGEHLICDIYERYEGDYRFRVRAAYTTGDWGLYWASGKWSRGSIEAEDYTPVYDVYDMLHGPGLPKKATWKNTSTDEESKETLRRFNDGMEGRTDNIRAEEWPSFLLSIEGAIKEKRAKKAYDARKAKLRKRAQDMPEMPADLGAWADQRLFHNREYVYYKRGKTWAECHCSKCGADYRIRTSRPNTFEGQLMRVFPVPMGDMPTNCVACGTNATYKPKGRVKGSHEEKGKVYVIQPFREGVVIRYAEMVKLWTLTGKSDVWCEEISRTYMGLRHKERSDWYLYDSWKMQSDWYDQNAGSYGNIPLLAGEVYMGNVEEWRRIPYLRYSAMEEYLTITQAKMKPTYYLSAAEYMPIEKLVKMGMIKLVERLVSDGVIYSQNGLIKCPSAREAHKMLGIKRDRLQLLREHAGDPKLLKVLQCERLNTKQAVAGERKGKGEWTEAQIWKVYNLALDREDIRRSLCYMSITQYLNRVEKYAKCEIPNVRTSDSCALDCVRHTAILYNDYLRLRAEGGYGMERDTDIFPRDLRKAHNDIVLERNRKEREDRMEAMEKQYPGVQKRYRSLKAEYGYKAEDIFIRPAKNIREIIEEGLILHHCVGSGDRYIRKHAEGESAILFCRNVKTPNQPYITIEVSDFEILQWYGQNDRKPDRERMEEYLKAWLEAIKERQKRRESLKAG